MPSPSVSLPGPLLFPIRQLSIFGHQVAIDSRTWKTYRFHKPMQPVKGRSFICSYSVEKYPSDSPGFVPMPDVKVIICPGFEFGIVGRIILVADRFYLFM